MPVLNCMLLVVFWKVSDGERWTRAAVRRACHPVRTVSYSVQAGLAAAGDGCWTAERACAYLYTAGAVPLPGVLNHAWQLRLCLLPATFLPSHHILPSALCTTEPSRYLLLLLVVSNALSSLSLVLSLSGKE